MTRSSLSNRIWRATLALALAAAATFSLSVPRGLAGWGGAQPLVTLPAGIYPAGLSHGMDSNLWLAVPGDSSILRVDSLAVATGFPATASSRPFDITTGPDRALWFTEQGGNRIGKLSVAGELTEFALDAAAGDPTQVLNGQDGRIWYTEFENNRVGWIEPDGSQGAYDLPTANSRPLGLAVDSSGNLWFTEWGGNRLGMIDLNGALTEITLPATPLHPAELILGPDDNLWFTYDNSPRVGRLNLSTRQAEVFTLATTSSALSDLAIGPDGRIWYVGFQTIGAFEPASAGPQNLSETALPAPVFESRGRSQLLATGDGRMAFSLASSTTVYTIDAGSTALRDLQLFLADGFSDDKLANGDFTAGVIVRNWSDAAADDVSMTVEIPEGIHLQNVTGASGGCVQAGLQATCALGSIAGDSTLDVVFTFTAADLQSSGGNRALTFAVSSAQKDYLPGTNRLMVPFYVRQSFDYFNDFSQAASSEWSHAPRTDPSASDPRLGNFSNENVQVSFPLLPPHDTVSYCYDLFITGDWDGAQILNPSAPWQVIGPDLWANYLDDQRLIATTFSNQESLKQSFPQNYPLGENPGGSGAVARGDFDGDGRANDARYTFCSVQTHTQDTLKITFFGAGLSASEPESWSLDNVQVRVYYQAAFKTVFLPNIFREK